MRSKEAFLEYLVGWKVSSDIKEIRFARMPSKVEASSY